MNAQIRWLFSFVLALFAVLVIASTWWSVVGSEGLEDNTLNRRPLLEAEKIKRGVITARDGTVLARSRRIGSGETRRYVRTYPQGSLFSHAVGYSFISNGDAGIERFRNDELTGQQNEFKTLLDELSNAPDEGDDLRTTLDTAGQRTARSAMQGRPGSVVAIEPDTGAVRVMLSLPDFDPNEVPDQFRRLNREPRAPLLNRASQSGYPPGSTFKVVTAAAALDTGRYTPDSIIDGRNGKVISGVPLQNFGGQDFGPVTLTDALTNSVNTVFGEVGENLGSDTMFRYMNRFGFNSKPELDYPANQLRASGEFAEGDLLGPDDPEVDVGRMAIGQDNLAVTPLQMAEVAAAVANDGVLMKPHLADRIVDPDGRTRDKIGSDRQSRVMSSGNARKLGAMMARVVEEGSGTAAALRGIPVAGKTGTAEVQNGQANQVWFIAFAPVNDPEIAVAVTVERSPLGSTGGEVAAPIAKQVMETLIGG